MHKNRNLDFLRNRENWTLTLSSLQFKEDQIESPKYFFLYFFEELWWLSSSSSAGAVMKTPLIDKIRANKKNDPADFRNRLDERSRIDREVYVRL
jgi:hypothetical protein